MTHNDKYKVLDTNVLMMDPKAIYGFPPKDGTINHIVVPLKVLTELEDLKYKGNSFVRSAASHAQKEMRKFHGNLRYGVQISDNCFLHGSFEIERNCWDLESHLGDAVRSHHDCDVFKVAYFLQEKGEDVEFISLDAGNLSIVSDLGIPANPWRDMDKGMPDNLDDAYKGWRKVESTRNMLDYLDKDGYLKPEALDLEDMMPNEFVIVSGHQMATTPLICKEDKLVRLFKYDSSSIKTPKGGFTRKDITVEQQCYIHALYDEDIKLVFAMGRAGSAKTFWASYAGLDMTINNAQKFDKMLITHPHIPTAGSQDIGALPGGLDEKMEPWINPIMDQLEQLYDLFNIQLDDSDKEAEGERFYEILPTLYARGRNLPNRFWIIDEAQNLQRPLLNTLLTRVANDSKVVLTGDPTQCDLAGVDALTNTIVWANERFKDYDGSATIKLSKCVRSELANESANRLGINF